MKTLTESANGWKDYLGDTLPEKSNWFVLTCGRNRDSGLLDNSNFDTAIEELGGESDTVEIRRFGHWACGWFEIVIIKPDSEAAITAMDIEKRLSNYPVLDESDYSDREYKATVENVAEALRMNGFDAEHAGDVYSWLADNDQSAVENQDDSGGYPDDKQLAEACTALGIDKE